MTAALPPVSREATRNDGVTDRSVDPPPFVVAIVLNWNNLPDTLEAVESLLASDYQNIAVWVVDNDSREDPTLELAAQHETVRVLRNEENLGYGGGNNIGVKWAISEGAEYVLLLNNDAVVAPDMVRRLVNVLERDRRIGMATPRVFYADRPTEVYWDGGLIDWKTGDTPHDSHQLLVHDGIVQSEWLDGCALLVRSVTVREIGFLDERYFLYFEDAEWSVRAGRLGWTNAVVLQASAWHKVSRSTGGLRSPAVRFYYARNRYLFMRSHTTLRTGLRWKIRYVQRIWRDYRAVCEERESREAIVAAGLSLLRRRWGAYERRGRDWWPVLVVDMLVLLATRAASLTGRCMRKVTKVGHLLGGGGAANRE